MKKDKEYFMLLALKEAKKAAAVMEIPVGAVVVQNDKVIARGFNRKETKGNAVLHAEMVAISAACRKLGSWRLSGCDLYVTLEPCAMCAGAVLLSRLDRVFIGTADEKTGSMGSLFNLFDYPVNHRPEIIFGILREDCEVEIKNFFKILRENKKESEKT